jgi:uncharacterized protein YndB with AHSA1/START domain
VTKQELTRDFAKAQIVVRRALAAPRHRVWHGWTDSVELDKWWGPRTWPATTKSFSFREGGHWHYCMTGPDGTRAWSRIDYLEITPGAAFTAHDRFCDERGAPDTSLPSTHWRVDFEDAGDATTLVATLTFPDEGAMQQIIDMGFEAGFTEQLDKLDEYLAA